ncbi:MAG: phage tail tape measure protein, partial [Proteobacteria bacterium]
FAGQAGLRGESATAAMAAHGTLSRLRVEGSKAGEHFNIILRGLQETLSDPSKQAAASKLGLSRNQLFKKINGEDNLRSIDELLPLLSPHVNRPEIAKLVGNDALSSMQILLTNLPLYKEIKAQLDAELLKGADNGAAALQARVRSEGLTGSLMELQGAFEELSIKLGDSGLLSEATRAIKSLEGLVEAIGKLDKQTLSTLTNVGLTMIAATGALMTFGAAAGALRNLGLIGGGASALGGGGLSSALAGSAALSTLSSSAAAIGAAPLSLLGVGAVGTAAMYANRDKMFPSQELFRDYSSPKAIDRGAFQTSLSAAAMKAREGEVSTALSSFAKNNFVESQLVRDSRLNKTLGISQSDLLGTAPPRDGKLIIDFKNVPSGLGVRTEGAVPDFNLDRGKIMVTP